MRYHAPSTPLVNRALLTLALCLLAATAWAQDAMRLFAEGHELLKAKRPQQAVAKFEQGLRADPNNAAARFFLGEAFLALQQPDKAREQYLQSLRLAPFGPHAQDANQRLAVVAGSGGGTMASAGTPSSAGAQPAAVQPTLAPAANEPAAGSVWTDPATGMEFAWVPSGCFTMGSAEGDKDELPTRRVCVKGFYMGRYEVTQAQYERLAGRNPSRFRGASLPVETVSWSEAKGFADEMAVRSGQRFRLPTEAEWEYACRAGEASDYCGRGAVENLAWYTENSGGTTRPVGTKRANGWGLHDMSGNVWEWVEDCVHSYDGAPTDGRAVTSGGNCSQRVNRGGSWFSTAQFLRAALRIRDAPSDRSYNLGFRLARTLP